MVIVFFFPKEYVFTHPECLAMFPCGGKIASDCNSFCSFFEAKRKFHCRLAGDGDVCDRKSRRLAFASSGALRLSG